MKKLLILAVLLSALTSCQMALPVNQSECTVTNAFPVIMLFYIGENLETIPANATVTFDVSPLISTGIVWSGDNSGSWINGVYVLPVLHRQMILTALPASVTIYPAQ